MDKETWVFILAIFIGVISLICGIAILIGKCPDHVEIQQCKDAGGIVVRSVWDTTMLENCIFKAPK